VSRLSEFRKILASYFTHSVVDLLAKTPLTPNTITWIGFLVTVGAGVLIVTGHLFAAGFTVLAAGFFDILDGALARRTNRVTLFGAALDSTLDRLAEAAILIGLLVMYAREQAVAEVVLVSVTLIGSQLVSYVRARAEGLGLKCEVGIFTRTERVVLLALGLLLSQFDYALIIALAIILVFSYVTVGQRLFYVWQQTKN
jgi:CDP-diacylglycerol--glycerol-3-phosphate 3-phosphatidyltransferase